MLRPAAAARLGHRSAETTAARCRAAAGEDGEGAVSQVLKQFQVVGATSGSIQKYI